MKAQSLIQERLRQRMLEAKLKNPQTSVRGLAKQLKLPAGTVSLVLLGKRKLSSKLAMKFADALYFDPMERARLVAAFTTVKKTSRKSKGAFLSVVETKEKFKTDALKLSADQFHVMKDWYYFAILNLTQTEDFKNDAEWIATRLNLKVEDAESALERLQRLGLLKADQQGKLRREYKRLNTSDQIENLSLRYSHYQNLELAKRSLDENKLEDRDFTWLTLPVNFIRMNEMKILVREFQDQFLEKFGEEKGANEVVRVAVQLFPLTNLKKESSKKMKTKSEFNQSVKSIFVGVLMMSPLANAQVGDRGGNGGGSEVCYTDSSLTTIAKAELYDFADNREHLTIPAWDGMESKDQIIARILKKIALTQPGLAREMKHVVDEIEKRNLYRNRVSSELVRVNDVMIVVKKENCTYRQMVNWMDSGQYAPIQYGNFIFRDKTFYDQHLDPLSQAGLDLHEAAYKVYRTYVLGEYFQYGSFAVRNLIAEAFSSGPITKNLIPTRMIDDFLKVEKDPGWNTHRISIRSACDFNDIDVTVTYVQGSYQKAVWYLDRSCGGNVRNCYDQRKGTRSGTVDQGSSVSFKLSELIKSHDFVFTKHGRGLFGFYGEYKIAITGCDLNTTFEGRTENYDSGLYVTFHQEEFRPNYF